MRRRSTFLVSWLCFGFAFLYIPIFVLILYSFNDSRLMSVWGGFSLVLVTAVRKESGKGSDG